MRPQFLLLLGAVACTEPSVPKVPPPAPAEVEALIPVTGAEFRQEVRARSARFVVANAWATWCGPCVEEFPYIQEVARSYADEGVALMFVSTDFDSERDAAIAFLKKQGADLPSYIKEGRDQQFIDAFHPDWSGALPATAIYGADGKPVKFWQGQVEEEDLRQTLAALAGRPADDSTQ